MSEPRSSTLLEAFELADQLYTDMQMEHEVGEPISKERIKTLVTEFIDDSPLLAACLLIHSAQLGGLQEPITNLELDSAEGEGPREFHRSLRADKASNNLDTFARIVELCQIK